METNGKFRAVPHLYVPLFCTLFNKGGNRRAFRLQGKGGDHFHCTVEPSPGHIRCRTFRGFPVSTSVPRQGDCKAVPLNNTTACRRLLVDQVPSVVEAVRFPAQHWQQGWNAALQKMELKSYKNKFLPEDLVQVAARCHRRRLP